MYYVCTYVPTVISWYHTVGILAAIMFGKINFIKDLVKKVRQIGIHSNCYVTYMWCLNGFSLAKLCSFAKFAKLFPCQTFPLYVNFVQLRTNIFNWHSNLYGQMLYTISVDNLKKVFDYCIRPWKLDCLSLTSPCQFIPSPQHSLS